MMSKGNKQTRAVNWPVTILLIAGCLTNHQDSEGYEHTAYNKHVNDVINPALLHAPANGIPCHAMQDNGNDNRRHRNQQAVIWRLLSQ